MQSANANTVACLHTNTFPYFPQMCTLIHKNLHCKITFFKSCNCKKITQLPNATKSTLLPTQKRQKNKCSLKRPSHSIKCTLPLIENVGDCTFIALMVATDIQCCYSACSAAYRPSAASVSLNQDLTHYSTLTAA